MRRAVVVTAGLLTLGLAGCGGSSTTSDTTTAEDAATERSAATTTAAAPDADTGAVRASTRRTIATNLNVPWGIAFLPDGDALVAERGGRVVRIAEGTNRKRTVMRIPGVRAEGEGGLLGLAVSPDYAKDKRVYAYTTTASDNRIVRFELGSRSSVTPILKGLRKGPIHDGGRIAFGPDGKLYAGVGDTGDESLAQDRSSQNGKILRMNADGSVPADNPFDGSRVYSLGHRNVQGLAWDRSGRLWAAEFGQNEFDEVNLVKPGANYGWPTVEGRGSTQGGRFTNPKVVWRTSEASPSGVAVVGSTLYVAALGGEGLWRVPLRGASTGTPKKLFSGRYGRIRTAVRAPGGRLWISTSNRDGRGAPKGGDDRILSMRAPK